MSVQRTYLAWYRAGLATALTGAPAAGKARAAVPAQISLNGGSAHSGQVPVELAGPGDVAGLDPYQVRRCEPYDGCPDFEPEYLAYVELAEADLPWRFSPIGPATSALADPEHPGTSVTQSRLTPWIALVVLLKDQVALAAAGPGGLPVLTCPATELPDPAETWAWAHVQVTTSTGDDPVAAAGDPGASVARLLCPRQLQPDLSYQAFLVPTFTAGVAAAGIDTGGRDPLSPAWSASGQAQLPVYFSWSFATSDAGTFETLARALRPLPAPATTGGRTVAVDTPGWGVSGTSGSTVLVQGALRPLATGHDDKDTGTSAGDPADDPADPVLAGQLATAVSASGTGLQLRPPIYGQAYAGGRTVVSATDPGWLAELNTDPRRRLAAGLGAWVVAVLQDDLADQAWQQLAAAGLARPTTADPALAGALSPVLAARADATPAAMLPSALARMSRPGGPIARQSAAFGALAALPTAAQPSGAATAPSTPLFGPVFTNAAHTWLSAVAPEWLLSAAGDVPDESLVVMRTNPAFTEAFMVGLNHALARELTWRRYPLDPAATMVRQFWSAAEGAPGTQMTAVADWRPADALGSHGPGSDELVLLIRGSLLRRFPTAAIYLSGTQTGGTEKHLPPSMSAALGPGTSFYGFPITAAEALTPDPASGVTAWYVVLQEAVDHIRYGLDDAPADGAPGTLTTWDDLDWASAQAAGHTYLPVAGPLAGVSRPAGPGGPTLTWGGDAGQLAAALTRPAFRIRIPVDLWLAPGTGTGTGT